MLRLTLPIVPSVNHCYRNVTVNRRILTPHAESWVAQVQLVAKVAMSRQQWVYSRDEKLVMEITTYWPDRRRRDTHNGHKLLADALEKVLYEDDRWVLIRDIDFLVDRKRPRVEITLRRLAEVESVG